MDLGIFGPKNGAIPKIHYATPTSRILFRAFVAVVLQPNSENSDQIHQADLLWERNEIWGPKFQRAQERELGPKKKLMGAWQYCLGEIYAKIYAKKISAPSVGRFGQTPVRNKRTFFLIVLVIFRMLRRSVSYEYESEKLKRKCQYHAGTASMPPRK